jgi:two-component system chemotaxis response regulator CheY
MQGIPVTGKRILIIDDNSVSRSILRMLLQEEGYSAIEEAGGGEQGLSFASRMKPDIIFLDVEMPRMGGLDVLVSLRELLPSAHVIMVTSNSQRATVQAAAERGANGYILKPFTQNTVMQAISYAYTNQFQQSEPPPGIRAPLEQPQRALPILVVEDDESLLQLYKANMSKWPFPVKIDTAQNGYEGLLILRNTIPRLLICDLHVPRVTGFQILQALTRMEQYRQTRIVVVSGMPPENVAERGGLPEGVEHIGKPIDFRRLESIAESLWQNWSQKT